MSKKNQINVLLVIFGGVIWAYVAAEYSETAKTGLETVLAEIFRPQKFMLNNMLIMVLLLLNNTEDIKNPQYIVRCRNQMFKVIVGNGMKLSVIYGIFMASLLLLFIRFNVPCDWSDVFSVGAYCGIFCVLNNVVYLFYNILNIIFNRVLAVIVVILADLVCLTFSLALDMDFYISMTGILWAALFFYFLLMLVMKCLLRKREYY
ncbi:MAG: hypothetical protein J1E62_07750 [Lachnospiraceae bacterium]|nr:hypothetical protein [Lachnospiraceae bacterium]